MLKCTRCKLISIRWRCAKNIPVLMGSKLPALGAITTPVDGSFTADKRAALTKNRTSDDALSPQTVVRGAIKHPFALLMPSIDFQRLDRSTMAPKTDRPAKRRKLLPRGVADSRDLLE